MKSKYLLILSFIAILTLMLPIFPLNRLISSEDLTNNEPRSSAFTVMNDILIINDLPGSTTNWSWAKDQGYCTGDGTISSPYRISNLFFNTSIIYYNCLEIRDSRKPFIIENCLLRGSDEYAGIKLTNTTNGLIRRNELYPLTGALVWIYNSSLNEVNNNNASAANYYGVLMDGGMGVSYSNIIVNNLISFNLHAGIQFRVSCSHNQILSNTIYNNTKGIEFFISANNNTVQSNIIRDNTNTGIEIYSDYNTIYQNCLINNGLHALDDGVDNKWDYDLKGNYWDNYIGLDNDTNGIGDVPYNIFGSAGSVDNYPLMKCPISSGGGGIPGYNVIILLIVGTGMLIGVIYLSLRKKLNFHSNAFSS